LAKSIVDSSFRIDKRCREQPTSKGTSITNSKETSGGSGSKIPAGATFMMMQVRKMAPAEGLSAGAKLFLKNHL
jgi:hypothetical protein